MKNSLKKILSTPIIYWIIIIISIIIGLIIRLKGLGKWPLALDEYYIVKSAGYILKHGLPQFPNGGYYSRGIFIQYLIAGLMSLGVKAEFAGRIFSVISYLIALPPLIMLSKKLGGKFMATVIVIVFSLSIWEIEFARFARMYAPFQAIFIWYIYFTYNIYINKNFKNFKWLIALSFFSIFVYEGSFFLAVFNFVPFILLQKIKPKYLFWTLIVFLFSVFFNMFDFRRLNCNPTLPPEYSKLIKASLSQPPIKIPQILVQFSFHDILTALLAVMLLLFNIFLVYKTFSILPKKNFWSVFSIILLALLAFINQFGFFIIVLLLLLFWKLLDIDFSDKKIVINISLIFIVNLLFWFSYGLLTKSWYVLFNDFSSYTVWGISKRLLVGFFNYPDNYLSLLNYFRTLPLLTSFSIISILGLFFILLSGKKEFNEIKFLSGVLIFLSILATIPTLTYEETRYTFFLAPVLLILVIYSVFTYSHLIFKNNILRKVSSIFLIFFIFLLSKDFNAYHILHIDKAEVNYRMIYKNNYFKRHLYRRWDILTPTSYVKKHLADTDLIMINENSHEFYLPRVDYFNFNYKHRAFSILSVEYGKKERWSNAKLIYTNKDLQNFIDNRSKTIWFTVYPENWLFEMDFYKRYRRFLVYEGIDKMIKVYKFPQKLSPSKIN